VSVRAPGAGAGAPGAKRPRLFDHHVHSDRSDGTVSLEGRAKSVAIRPHGVSDHYPWRDKLRNEDDLKRYLEDATKLGLHVGIEYDLGVAPPLSPGLRDALHYVIGAIHQVELDGKWIRYDDAGDYVKGRAKLFKQAALFSDPELRRRILERTLVVVAEGIDRDRIDILGHPTFSALQALGDPEKVYPEEWQERLIDLCVKGGIAIEINESYGVPHREFLVRAARAGALFSVGTDTHFELKPLDKTEAMIAAARLDTVRFRGGSRSRSESAPRAVR
jgi:histidinol phosphatase-like PHP family hydrolase